MFLKKRTIFPGHSVRTAFAALSEIDLLVTDSGLTAEDQRKLRRASLDILKD